MNHAVISCLHANLAAVEAVLDDIDSQGIQTITCLGDLVGYGTQPNEVVELSNGCICCSINGELMEAVERVIERPEPLDYIADRADHSARVLLLHRVISHVARGKSTREAVHTLESKTSDTWSTTTNNSSRLAKW